MKLETPKPDLIYMVPLCNRRGIKMSREIMNCLIGEVEAMELILVLTIFIKILVNRISRHKRTNLCNFRLKTKECLRIRFVLIGY